MSSVIACCCSKSPREELRGLGGVRLLDVSPEFCRTSHPFCRGLIFILMYSNPRTHLLCLWGALSVMGIEKIVKTCKDRLVDSWHQPWIFSSSANVATGKEHTSYSLKHRRRGKALSNMDILDMGQQCTFLISLPGEIRNTIYALVLGNRHLRIQESGDPPRQRRIRHEEIMDKEVPQTILDSFPRPSSKLALLQTCRQIYREAADILYSTNNFDMSGIGQIKAFNHFTEIISPTRLACIRSLTLMCEVNLFKPLDPGASYFFRHWERLWSTMSLHMSALRHLKLQLVNLWLCQDSRMTLDSYWVKPMLKLRNMDTFELVVDPSDIVTPRCFSRWQNPSDTRLRTIRVEALRGLLKQHLCSRG